MLRQDRLVIALEQRQEKAPREIINCANPCLEVASGRVPLCGAAHERAQAQRRGRARSPVSGMKKKDHPSRRHNKRYDTPQGIWVLWKCGKVEDMSKVRDVSVGGLFIETLKVCRVGTPIELHFLVEDGEIRATAMVRYVSPSNGMGLQFKTVRSEDQERFSAMIKRLIQVSGKEQ